MTLETVPLISVTVYPEDRGDEKYVNIYISDTGNGFPEETLQRLKAGEDISEHGKHIGIENCLKRFRYYYGDSGEIHFDNSPLGGIAIIHQRNAFQAVFNSDMLSMLGNTFPCFQPLQRLLRKAVSGVSRNINALHTFSSPRSSG